MIKTLAKDFDGIPASVKFLDSSSSNRTIAWDFGKFHADADNPWYQAEIQWAEDCTGPPQNAGWPMELYSAGDIIYDIFEED